MPDLIAFAEFDVETAALEWLAVNQYAIKEKDVRRPDTVVIANGLPLAIFEFKNAADENATIEKALDRIPADHRRAALEQFRQYSGRDSTIRQRHLAPDHGEGAGELRNGSEPAIMAADGYPHSYDYFSCLY